MRGALGGSSEGCWAIVAKNGLVKPPREKPADRRGGGFVGQSAKSSVAALLAMLSGLLLDVALAARLGAGRQSDEFFAAARIPIGLSALLMTVAVQAWVPVFARDRRDNGAASLTVFASRVWTLVAISGLVLCGIATVVARPLMAITAPGLNGHELDAAATLVPQMFLLLPLVGAAEVVRGALNASKSFVVPAAMNVSMNGFAAGMILLSHGHNAHTVVLAYVLGATFQLVVIGAFAWSKGIRVHPSFGWRDPRLRAASKLTGRPLVSSLLNLGNRTVEQAIASFLPSGSITVLSYGQRLISALGGGTFFRPITVALIPRLADRETIDSGPKTAALVHRALTMILAISLPLTALTIALAEPTIHLVFHRGNFGPSATHLLALTLAIYGASLLGSGAQRVLLAPFYARLNTRMPLRNTAYGVAVDLFLLPICIALCGWHRSTGVLGVAIAYSLDQYFIVGHAWWRLRKIVPIGASSVLRVGCKVGVASAGGAAVMLFLVRTLGLTTTHSRLSLFLLTSLVALIGLLIMAGATYVLLGRGGWDVQAGAKRSGPASRPTTKPKARHAR